jgi:hypothetical protein
LLAAGSDSRVIISVEAKVDEPFGDEKIGSYWRNAQKSADPTRVPERIEALLS